jgi:hypothetical protein
MIRLRYLVVSVLLVALGGAAWMYRAARTVPEFYQQTLVLEPQAAEKSGNEFTEQTFELANRVRDIGKWSALFTDEQVNGWLATEMPQKHPELVPEGFADPRVRFGQDGLQFGVQYTAAGVQTVVWLDVEVSMTESREAALRFRRVRAGDLPLPLGHVLDALTQVAEDLHVPLRWTTVDGDPTALIALSATSDGRMRFELEQVKISAGRLFVSGRTLRPTAAKPGAAAR